jgi:hypothetical protein
VQPLRVPDLVQDIYGIDAEPPAPRKRPPKPQLPDPDPATTEAEGTKLMKPGLEGYAQHQAPPYVVDLRGRLKSAPFRCHGDEA